MREADTKEFKAGMVKTLPSALAFSVADTLPHLVFVFENRFPYPFIAD